MNYREILRVLIASLCAILLPGCAGGPKTEAVRQTGESVVLIGEQPATLAHLPLQGPGLRARSTYLIGSSTVQYEEGRDFLVDYAAGTLHRTPGSRVPDFATNMLYGKKEFDHSQFPGFGNGGFFVFVDYTFTESSTWPVQASQAALLPGTRAKLVGGEAVKIIAYGDSITAGGDASRPELIFWQRWADHLQVKYPRAQVTAINGATGGDSTADGVRRLQQKVINAKPDLVLLGFGMNDHNISGVPVPQFEKNLIAMIGRIRGETGAEVVLFSAFPPNPHWKFGSQHMQDYAAATERVARTTTCAYADVFSNWQTIAARKKPEDLLGNNINHPNDFGHWIYFQVLQALDL